MTNEEKQLILTKDICSRAAYWLDLKVDYNDKAYTPFGFGAGRLSLLESPFMSYTTGYSPLIGEIKPYLRPMSSMTEKEQKEFDEFICIDEDAWKGNGIQGFINQAEIMSDGIDYLLAHHFDFRGLIEKGLALEAPEDMYKTE